LIIVTYVTQVHNHCLLLWHTYNFCRACGNLHSFS